MPYVYLVAAKNDPSAISCYVEGERVRIDISGSLPFVATKSNGTTFRLRHLDHFMEENEFHDCATSLGLTQEAPHQVESKQGLPWGKIALGVGLVALVAAVGVGGYKYVNKKEEKSLWDEFNPWYKKPTLKDRIKKDFTKATDTVIDRTVTVARENPIATRMTCNLLQTVLDPRTLGPSNITSVYNHWTAMGDRHRFTELA